MCLSPCFKVVMPKSILKSPHLTFSLHRSKRHDSRSIKPTRNPILTLSLKSYSNRYLPLSDSSLKGLQFNPNSHIKMKLTISLATLFAIQALASPLPSTSLGFSCSHLKTDVLILTLTLHSNSLQNTPIEETPT